MRILEVEVIMRTVDVSGDDGGELAAILLCIRVVRDINHALGVSVGAVREVWRTVVHHGLVDGVRGLVREDTSRETGDELLHLVLVRALDNVVVHGEVIVVELNGILHVAEETTDKGSQVNHVSGSVLLEQSLTCLHITAKDVELASLQRDTRRNGMG